MKRNIKHLFQRLRHTVAAGCLLSLSALLPTTAAAQLSSNPDKFLGNITTRGQVDYGNEKFYQLWNEITPENETKWASVEGTRGRYNWNSVNYINNYAKQHGFPFKFHTLVWGSQFPGWFKNLSVTERYTAIVKWMDAAKKQYPDLAMIDVVNEAIDGHQADTHYMSEALGGPGKTGYDWIIKAFEMAYERWPNAILIYNDFNTFQWNTDQFIDLVRTLRNAGAPIDAYGCQSHDLTDCNVSNFKSAMQKIQNALKIPMYSTEYDIGTDDDALQLQRYKEQIPYMWEADYCAGITLWGYIYGATWTTNGNSGIIRNGQDRPAMEWLRQYMASDAAKNAKSPFPGMKKEASVYIKPATIAATVGDVLPIEVRASMRTKTIDHVDLYVKNKLFCTMTEAPYKTEYEVKALGAHALKAVVVNTDGTQYERLGSFTAYNPRAPYKGVIDLPGTIEGEHFDSGADGISYHDSDTQNQGGASVRSDATGVDIESISGGYAISYTRAGEWLEYTVNVNEAGLYEYDAYMSSQDGGGSFSLALSGDNGLTDLTGDVPVARTGAWSTYKMVHGRLTRELEAGPQVLRFIVNSGNLLFNFDKIVLRRIDVDTSISISISANPSPAIVGEDTKLTVNASSAASTIARVDIYTGQMLLKSLTTAPFTMTYKPTAKGVVKFTAIATDAEGRQSRIATYTLGVNNMGDKVPAKRFTSLSSIGSTPFAIVDEEAKKAFYGSDNQNLGFAEYVTAFADTNTGYLFKLESLAGSSDSSIKGCYLLRLIQPDGSPYSIWGSPGYLNGHSTQTDCSFILGLNNQNGQDVKNGAVWDINYVEGKGFTMLNKYTGKYLHDNLSAKYDTPAYFNFCTLGAASSIAPVTSLRQQSATSVYSLHGMKVGTADRWGELPRGLYIVNGKKVFKE